MAEFDRDSLSKLDATELSEEALSAKLSANRVDTPLARSGTVRSQPPAYSSPEPGRRPSSQFEVDDMELRRAGTGDTQMPRIMIPVQDHGNCEPERGMPFYKPRSGSDKKRPFMIAAIAVLFAALVAVSTLLGLTLRANAKCELGPKTVTVTSTTVSTLAPSTVTSIQVSTLIESITETSIEVLTAAAQPTTVETTDMETEDEIERYLINVVKTARPTATLTTF